jgi:ribosomal protein L7/L12
VELPAEKERVICFGLANEALPPEPAIVAVSNEFSLCLESPPVAVDKFVLAVDLGGLSQAELEKGRLVISFEDQEAKWVLEFAGAVPQGLRIVNLCDIYYTKKRNDWRISTVANGWKEGWDAFFSHYSQDESIKKRLFAAIEEEEKKNRNSVPAASSHSYCVVLYSCGERKQSVTDWLRLTLGLNREQVNSFVENLPEIVKGDLSREEAEQLLDELKQTGGTGKIRT